MKRIYICILFAAFILTGCGSKSSITLKGDIADNTVSVSSTVGGKVIKMNKNQGEKVKKGDLIALIDNSSQKYQVAQLQAVVDMKKAKLSSLNAGTRTEQIEQAKAQVKAAGAQLDLLKSGNRQEQINQSQNNVSIAQQDLNIAQTQYDNSKSDYEKYLILNKSGAISQKELEDVKLKMDTSSYTLLSAKSKLDNARQQLNLMQEGSTSQAIETASANYEAANAQLKLLENGPTDDEIKASQEDLNQSIAQLSQAKNELNKYNITALSDGIIISKNFELGDIVTAGSNIADIAVTDDLYVICYLPDKYLDKIHYNQYVNVKTSLGIQKGKINYIDLKKGYTPKDKQSTSDKDHITTKIKIAIKDKTGILKSGMTAEVEIPFK
ncbi:HlyD family secretion protein [Clostridium sp. MT-14]|jgi:HlyD family secretion protein|uniref:HlyD family secretion protein n=1 Tax=unclassified Clostridium TaxID=2614128 RepID=UPI00123A76E7|nr:HlyD family efflux transporter periplasmic adaptor subunit [Clostridium sp. HV4-5-A1G]KAA8674978.1 HlyD family efflux transporter periplasmic adaptor subunit [Clostridium sp. HV4-5-A1G]CAB1255126.1 Putative efflux pump membrane fusion protein [Clostridiaceae bacterium BL-3]